MDRRRRLDKLEEERQADAAYKVRQVLNDLDDEDVAQLLTGSKSVREKILDTKHEDFDGLVTWALGGDHAWERMGIVERSRRMSELFGDSLPERSARRTRVVTRIKEIREEREEQQA